MKFGPLFGLSTTPATPEETIADIRQYEAEGAHGICLHMSKLAPEYWDEETFRKIIASARTVEIYASCYRNNDSKQQTDDERAGMMRMMARAGASIVDVMGDMYDPTPGELTENKEAIEKQKALIAELKLLGVTVLMSSHVLAPRSAEEAFKIAAAQRDRGADIAKIVLKCDTEAELAESRRTNELLRTKLGIPFVHVCSGEMGKKVQRYETLLTGSCMSFVRHDESDTQPSVAQALAYLREQIPWATAAENRTTGEFIGHSAIVVGAASGLGLLASKRLAALGASVLMVDVNQGPLEAACKEITGDGGKAITLVANARKYEDAEKAAQTAVEKFGRIDFLLFFAGGHEPRCCHSYVKFYEQPIEVLDWGLEVNLRGPIYFARACMPTMIKQKRGVIVCLGSVSGVEADANGAMYSVSKSGLFQFTKCLALAGAPYNVRAVCVAPGPVMTRPGMANMHTPLNRAAEPIEVVNLIQYLLSEKASFISGSTHFIDGARNTNFGK